MLHILLICTGNTCRSPMAEALLRSKVKENDLEGHIAVSSAGIAVWGQVGASAEAQAVMASQGLDLTNHHSCQLINEHIAKADLVLTMTEGHKRAVLSVVPCSQDKVYTLSEFAGEQGDVYDPYGGDFVIYQECAKEIEKILGSCWRKIRILAGKKN